MKCELLLLRHQQTNEELQTMGAACSSNNKVTQIKVAPRAQIESSFRDDLFMNFGNYDYKTATANVTINDNDTNVSSISSLEMEQTKENIKTLDKGRPVNQRIAETTVSKDRRKQKQSSQAGKAFPDIVARDTVTKDTGTNMIKNETFPNKNSIDITRKVGKILDTLIPPESPVQNPTQVGRQSRLMHADMNTVVSYDVTGTAEALRTKGTQKQRKGKPTLITVQPGPSNISASPLRESPTKFHVCKHGIPFVVDIDDDEELGCDKCQRPESRGGRELQELLKARRASRRTKRKAWAKSRKRRDTLVENWD